MSAITLISDLMIAQSAAGLALAARTAAERPIGTIALNIDLYRAEDRAKSIIDARWTVARFSWNGSRWRRIHKLTGPLKFERAIDELIFHSNRFDQPIAADI